MAQNADTKAVSVRITQWVWTSKPQGKKHAWDKAPKLFVRKWSHTFQYKMVFLGHVSLSMRYTTYRIRHSQWNQDLEGGKDLCLST